MQNSRFDKCNLVLQMFYTWALSDRCVHISVDRLYKQRTCKELYVDRYDITLISYCIDIHTWNMCRCRDSCDSARTVRELGSIVSVYSTHR